MAGECGGTWSTPWRLTSCGRLGGWRPRPQPASFVLNGVPQGLYVLVEHVREPFLMSRFGHENFDRADGAPPAALDASGDQAAERHAGRALDMA